MERLKTSIILLLLAALAGSIAWAATSGEAEVRITARRLADGRTEFALQQRVDGEWGERQLPASRYFPASVSHNRWLNSTSLTVSVVGSEMEDTAPTTSADTPQSARSIRTTAGEGVTDGGAHWLVWFDEFDDSRRSYVSLSARENNSLYNLGLALRCSENGTRLDGWLFNAPISDINDQYTVTTRFDSKPATTLTLRQFSGSGDDVWINAQTYRQEIERGADKLAVRVVGYSRTVTVTFNLSTMREASTWPNIVACGN